MNDNISYAFCRGYLARMKDNGDALKDVTFSELSGRTRDHILNRATEELTVENVKIEPEEV